MIIIQSQNVGRIIAVALIAGIILSSLIPGIASAETYVYDGEVMSMVSVTETTTIRVTGLNLSPSGGTSMVTYNAPLFDTYEVSGFSQSVSGLSLAVTPAPLHATDYTDGFGNRYRRFEWMLNKSNTTFDAVIVTTFNATLKGDLSPEDLKDRIGAGGQPAYLVSTAMIQSDDPRIKLKGSQLTAGVNSQAEAVDRVINYVKTTIEIPDDSQPRDAVASLDNPRGNCVNKANLALALLRSQNISARYVSGMTLEGLYFIYFNTTNGTVSTALGWLQRPHAWIEVYYPVENVWVPYDPDQSKGFVDHRHIKAYAGIDSDMQNPATHGDPGMMEIINVNLEAYPTVSSTISALNRGDNVALQYMDTIQSPGSPFVLIGRELQGTSNRTSSVNLTVIANESPINNTVILTASVLPQRSDGIVAIQKSPDGVKWVEHSSGAPSAGNFTAQFIPILPGKYYFRAVWSGAGSYPSAESKPVVLVVNDPYATPTPLPPGNYVISGHIREADVDRPVPNATVTIGDATVNTDPHGNFEYKTTILKTENSTIRIAATAEGFGTSGTNITLSGGSDVNVTLLLAQETPTPKPTPMSSYGLLAALATMAAIALLRGRRQ